MFCIYPIETGFYSLLASMTGFPLKKTRRYRIFGQLFSNAHSPHHARNGHSCSSIIFIIYVGIFGYTIQIQYRYAYYIVKAKKKKKNLKYVQRVRTGPPADEPPSPHHRTCATIVRKQFNSF